MRATDFKRPSRDEFCVGIMAHMAAMNDTYASTCAVTIPVLALAGFIEVRATFRLLGEAIYRRRDYGLLFPIYLADILIICTGWVVLMWYSVWSEDACLNYMLTHQQAQGDAAATSVKSTLLWLLITLVFVFLPTLGLILIAMGVGGKEGSDGLAHRRAAVRRRTVKSRARQPAAPTAHGTGDDPSTYLG